MCCFIGDVENVWDTQIFARRLPGRQFLVYQMRLSTANETAMVLPVPVKRNGRAAADDDLKFINLSTYPDFFADLRACFPREQLFDLAAGAAPVAAGPPPLEVHSVGAYEASFVPSIADFKRLDARFRLPDRLWKTFPAYADYAFAVFRIKPGTDLEFHPMAFQFPVAKGTPAYFPTVHVHDGEVREWAGFDHQLFLHGLALPNSDWELSRGIVGDKVDAFKAKGVLAPNEGAWRREMKGTYENRDVRVAASA